MNRIIAVTCSDDYQSNKETLHMDYITALTKQGALPVIVSNLTQDGMVAPLLDKVDGVLLTGGVDVDPTLFGEEPIPGQGEIQPERDRLELSLVKQALERNIPVLGICRGTQIINVALGGNVMQDIATHIDNPLKHQQRAPGYYGTHHINVSPQSFLKKLFPKVTPKVNSFHHQACKELAPDLRPAAWSEDGIIEAVESTRHKFCIGVQWHPERMASNKESSELFRLFVKEVYDARSSTSQKGR